MKKQSRDYLIKVFRVWLPLAIITTALCGLIYLVIQQDIRIGANDPQIQLAEDVAAQLSTGQNPQYFVPPIKMDISKSLATFIMIFDSNGKLIASSASLDGKDPVLPPNVFPAAKSRGETRFTWQPKTGVRNAVVIDYFKGPKPGYVLVGRSLKEIENRETGQEIIIFFAWIVTIFASFISVYILEKIR